MGKVYKHNNVLYDSWYLCRITFPNVSFPEERMLRAEHLKQFGIEVVDEQRDVRKQLKPNQKRGGNAEDVSILQKHARLRRDNLLNSSDKYLMEDYPIKQLELDSIKSWRQYLRDYTKTNCWWEHEVVSLFDWMNSGNVTINCEEHGSSINTQIVNTNEDLYE